VPPLRERREDIPSLAALFLEHAAIRHRKRIQGLEPNALELLTNAGWPGNVRQLQNEMERAVAVAQDGDAISLRHLSPELKSSAVGRARASAASLTSHIDKLRQQLVMTPPLQEAIKILQLSLPELEAVVQKELDVASVASGSPASGRSASLADLLASYEHTFTIEDPAFAHLLRRYQKPSEASVLADRIASALPMELESKQALLETPNPAERLEKLLSYLNALS
jgi:DNA-binding NtrC family response regulator